jgi:hypothetical protein
MFDKEDKRLDGIYRGKVIDNNDASKYGRVKVQVYPYFSDIEAAALPWAKPAFPLSSGSGSGTGSFALPDNDSYVFVFFEMGDPYQPVYFAEAADAVHGLPSERTTNYPKRRVIKTAAGFVIYVDDTAKDLKVLHPDGSYVHMKGNKDIDILAKNDVNVESIKVLKLTVGSRCTVDITNNCAVSAGGSIDIDVPMITTTGNLEVGGAATGTFTSADGKVITVTKGIVISIV